MKDLPIESGAGAGQDDGGVVIKEMCMTNEKSLRHAFVICNLTGCVVGMDVFLK